MSALVTGICLLMIVYMVYRIIVLLKRNKANKKLIDLVNSFNDEQAFFAKCEQLTGVADPEMAAKAFVIQFWGAVRAKKYDLAAQALERLKIGDLLPAKEKDAVRMNEDSFFYLYLVCPNMLYADHQEVLMKQLQEKMLPVQEAMKNELCRAIGEADAKYYAHQGDLGASFYAKVQDGEYDGYQYSKGLISLYKLVVSAMQARIYLDQGTMDGYQALAEDLREFAKYPLGERWLKQLNVPVPPEAEKKPEEDKDGKDSKAE